MEIFTSRKGRTFKTVTFINCHDFTDAQVFAEALAYFNETTTALFGWQVKRVGGSVTVDLYTD